MIDSIECILIDNSAIACIRAVHMCDSYHLKFAYYNIAGYYDATMIYTDIAIESVMAIAPEPKKFKDHFYDIQDNINWELIKPSLEETQLLSSDELTAVWCKDGKKRLKYLMKKITDSDKEKLFIQALKNTSHDDGHKKLLEILKEVHTSGKQYKYIK